jgi:type IV secretory pathway VirB10-like protein
MDSSRDSSVWRSLAVTFGGGLALGAVGMKLTQTALRPAEAPPRPEPNILTGRLSNMERRLEQMEQSSAPARAPAASQPPSATIDQKVLEAVIGAVDARLHEHAGQIDRRLADLEARMAVMQSLDQQDRQAAEQLRQEAADFRTALQQDMRQVRENASRAAAGQTSVGQELQILRQQQFGMADATEKRFAEMRQEHRQGMSDLRHEIEQSVEARMVTAAAAAAAAKVEEHLAPLRAEIQQKEQELTELRERLVESERSVLDVILAMGALCRQAADRINSPRETTHTAAPPPPAPPAPTPESLPKSEAAAPAEPTLMAPPAHLAKVETMPAPQAVADPELAQAIPDFLHESNHRSWRIPLVSSFLVSTGYLVLMHYLSAPLQ